jgi:pyruvate dehydrogenase E2 component (dihydrolipoamide acetyltransferase)
MHASADARAILSYMEKVRNSKRRLGLREITLNDIVVYAAVRTLKNHTVLNAHFLGDRIVEFSSVHAGFAVATDRALMVPVIRFADRLSLKALSDETRRLAGQCMYGGISPDDLTGGTVTFTNLSGMGVEMFTPILNPPQVAILGICDIQQKPVLVNGETEFWPHIGFSLTLDHQAVDGVPAARFLKALCEAIAGFELILAV